MTIYKLGDKTPTMPENGNYWIAPGAHVVGMVNLGEDTSVWFNSVLRGDNEPITIGAGSNIQENVMIHSDPGYPVTIGKGCTIGHHAVVHGCSLGDNTLIWMGATILNGAQIGKDCLVGANALVTEGKSFPDGSLIMGAPAKAVRELDPATVAQLRKTAGKYVENYRFFKSHMSEID